MTTMMIRIYNQVGTDWTADPSRSCGRCRAELGRIINRGAVCRSALINNPATKMINLQGLQYPSLQELSRFLPGPGLALPGLQEKQVSLSSQNLKVKSGALIWYICTLLYLTYILWDQSWGRKKLKACHNSNRFTIWRSQEGKVVAKVCPVQWWPLLPKFTLRCRVNASLPHCHICTSLHLILGRTWSWSNAWKFLCTLFSSGKYFFDPTYTSVFIFPSTALYPGEDGICILTVQFYFPSAFVL